MEKRQYRIVGIGELVWDIFEGGKHLGGAPANFAYSVRCLGEEGLVATAVGTDELGEEALRQLQASGVPTDTVQIDPEHPTSTAQVAVDRQGQPTFEIRQNVAWDFLTMTPAWRELAGGADAVCFGSLAQRSDRSRATTQAFLDACAPHALKIFDVNLRQTFFSTEVLAESLQRANIAKLNDQEVEPVCSLLGVDGADLGGRSAALRAAFDLDLVCVTQGPDGCLLVSAERSVQRPGVAVAVADTVGAGDAFTAAMTCFRLWGAPLEVVGDAANQMGSFVASQAGATPLHARRKAAQILEEFGSSF